jgi:hypothetical protein
MPLSGPISPTVFADGELVTQSKMMSRIYAVINGVRDVVNPKTSIWLAVQTASGITIPDSTWMDALLDATTIDSDGIGIGSNGYVAPANGRYLVSGSMRYSSSVFGFRCIATIAVNGSRSKEGFRSAIDSAGASVTAVPTAVGLVSLSKGDLVTV